MTRKKLTLHEASSRSSAELIDVYGSDVLDQLADLVAAAVWKGDDAEVALVDRRLREVEAILGL